MLICLYLFLCLAVQDAQAIGADSSLGDRVVSGVVPKDGDILWNGSDVIVVGAGVSGLSAACELASEGLCVTVLEASSRVGKHDVTSSLIPLNKACMLPKV